MANKRTRKKIAKKQDVRVLERKYTKKQIKQLKSHDRAKLVKKEKENIRKRDNYQLFRSLGFSSKESNRMKNWSQSRITDFLNEYSTQYLLVVYKDVTEETDSEALDIIKYRTKRRSRKSIETSILGWLDQDINQGYIGGYKMETGNKEEIAFHQKAFHFQKYLQAYYGQGKQLKPLLNLLENMMVLLYTVDDKDDFVEDLVSNLRDLPYPEAHANAEYIEENFTIDRSNRHF
ncbi:cytoplasmic protein [Bacillus pseudomycoides]|uniref:Cytoplasmic protein n=1 Tax=Bacillus pseudomycoides TaxID=64104 RepID=A0AA91VBT2_9BACI|nr:cytoplasmic protein [Bacillus pseudomycoides]PED82305.1 cytoplasmic protein [Bacillus pseudomycoides]